MKLFEKFKETIPSNTSLVKNACGTIIDNNHKISLKEDISLIVQKMHDKVYEDYKSAEIDSWKRITTDEKGSADILDFDELQNFFKSLGNSRKSRAGKVFELIIEEIMSTRLGYPLVRGIKVDGARPDFVLPSKEFLQKYPLDSILLTAKRTLRERWRQVVTEANVAHGYFLATLDEDISANQLIEAERNKVFVITTRDKIERIEHYGDASYMMSFEDFIKFYLDPVLDKWDHYVI